MYNLKINLIGCDEDVLPHIRREIIKCNAEIDAEFADAQQALQKLRLDENEMRLFIVHVNSPDELSQLRQLSGTFVGRPILALVDGSGDSSLVLKAMRSGAAQVVTMPLQSEDFREAMDCIALQFGSASGRAKILAVCGTTGGCGCTTLAVNFACEMGVMKQVPCILAELSLRMGVLANHLDVRPRYTTADLLAEINRLDSYVVQQALTNVAENVFILPGPYESIQPCESSVEDVLKLIDLTRHLASIVILDVPCLYDDLHFRVLSLADQVVLVVEQQVASVRGASMICNMLQERRPIIIINRYNPKIEGFSAGKLRDLLQPRNLWTVAEEESVVAATNNGRPLRLENPRSRALADIDQIIEQLFPEYANKNVKKNPFGIFGRLTRALARS
ncbi:MAG: hypothetical protein JXB10_15375 [Pirellulales bacterium]|nr:hypothetical protein [Pirellulales bacterium]